MAIELFATYSDVVTRTGDASLDEARVTALIEDASAMLLNILGNRYDANDESQQVSLRAVCCSMVQRAATTPDGFAGVSQFQQTAGPYSASTSFSNPSGDLYLTSSEKKAIGASKMVTGTLRPKIGVADDTW